MKNQHLQRVIIGLYAMICFTNSVKSQSIQELFKALGTEYFWGFDSIAKDSLLQWGYYNLPASDSLESVSLEYYSAADYIQIIHFYPNGPSGFSTIQLRKFSTDEGQCLLVYSRHSGSRWLYFQDSLVVFDNTEEGLIPSSGYGLLSRMDYSKHLKASCPDSIQDFSQNYNLNPESENAIAYGIFAARIDFQEWIAREEILFYWNGKTFIEIETR
ncbi:hypothetical protein [Croceimicrobium sp.]|uniref:hypothetical protein n=1 Tax=Croceimicrobium sp. TaxID=2828340 RepID=UPI003BACE7AB